MRPGQPLAAFLCLLEELRGVQNEIPAAQSLHQLRACADSVPECHPCLSNARTVLFMDVPAGSAGQANLFCQGQSLFVLLRQVEEV